MKVLIVDRVKLFQQIISSVLDSENIQHKLCSTGAETLAILAQESFDIICLSLYLDDTDALKLCQKIRLTEQYAHTPVLLITSEESDVIKQQALKTGITDIFDKKEHAELINFMWRFSLQDKPVQGRVLYIEDSLSQQQVMTALLKDIGLTVDTYSTGDEAWDAFQKKEYDLVITDILLDGAMSGITLASHIRRIDGNVGDTPILAVTAFDNISRRIGLFHLGINDYVIKPVVTEELFARVKNLTENYQLIKQIKAEKEGALKSDAAKSKLLQLVLDSIPTRVFWKDKKLNFLGANTLFAKDAGYKTPKEIIGKSDFDMAWKDQEAELYQADDRSVMEKNQAKLGYEESQTTPDGGSIWRQANKIPLLDDDGSVFGILGTYEDITKRKLVEEELSIAKDAALQSNIAKSEFLANISHELRPPLHGILSFSQFGIKKINSASPEKLLQYFLNIEVSGSRLLVLVNDLLDLSKIEAGQMDLNIQKTNLVEVFNRCQLEQQQRVKDLGLTVEINIPSNLVVGVFDAVRIGQVITNILSNAIKFSPKNSVLTATIEINRDKSLLFTLKDSGIGIPEEELEDVFDAFVQSSKTNTGTGGTGLGLAISKQIISAHNGRIWAGNNEGGGVIFCFTLPQ